MKFQNSINVSLDLENKKGKSLQRRQENGIFELMKNNKTFRRFDRSKRLQFERQRAKSDKEKKKKKK